MPGGLLDAGESPADAAIRETREETGVAIELTREPLVLLETNMQRVTFIYEAVPADGVDPDTLTPQASEILEVGWFNPAELPDTIPDMSGELFLRQDATQVGSSVFVTGAMPPDMRPITE
jgi:8-oxo-dGTP diphosphatase